MDRLEELIQRIDKFNKDRDWNQNFIHQLI